MKIKTFLLLCFIACQSYSQVSVGPRHVGRSKNFKKGVLEKFKNTETIFVLSSVYEKEVYEKILKESWNVTPYKVVELHNFNIENYLSDKYSFANLSGFERIKSAYGGTYKSLYTYVDFQLFDHEKIFSKFG